MTMRTIVLERLTHVTPLGLRLWDSVTGRAVADDLSVVVYPRGAPARRVLGAANRSGVFVFLGLPGLRAAEFGAGDDAFWGSPPSLHEFVIEVVDPAGRFLSFVVPADVPARGLLALPCAPVGSPPDRPPAAIPLFTAPARPIPSGMAVLRADLWDPSAARPAAWAVLEAHLPDDRIALGIADSQGRAAVVFPYPEPAHLATVSPPGPRRSLYEQTWSVTLRARYAPEPTIPTIPDLCRVLAQPPASLWTRLSPPQPLPAQTLEFAKELIVRSSLRSVLFVTPAGSPPD